ncbi:MAG: response regulator [Cyclobacteriaceae bacterium]|nr:response regulator [Cyclobacteriaceae bacterium]
MSEYKQFSEHDKKVLLKIFRLTMILILLTATFFSFAQSTHEEEISPVANHTFTVLKEYDSFSNRPIHLATPPVKVVFWESAWFRFSAGFLIVGILLFIQRLRVRTIQKMRRAFENELIERNEEVLRQVKTVRIHSDSLLKLRGQFDSLQKSLEDQIEKTEKSEQTKANLLAMISYGVNSPLNGLKEISSSLKEVQLTKEMHECSAAIENHVNDLQSAVHDIFDFAKIEAGQIKLDEKEFNLRRCIEDVLEVFASKSGDIDFDLVYRLRDDVPVQIWGDAFRLKQVLTNLIANVLKFTQQVEDIFIDVQVVKTEGDIHTLDFQIHNSGYGIHYESAVSMFKSSSYSDNLSNDQYGGTGLGLPTCENLVRLMGGTIVMESHRGKGSTFSFAIKFKTDANRFKGTENFETDQLEGKNVLLVHNHSISLNVLKDQLQRWKMNVTAAASGFEAMKFLSERSSFDLVITDLKMQGFDGVQLGQAIRKFHSSLPVILLSPKDNERAKKEGDLFNSIISKPVRQAVFHKHLSRCVISFDRYIAEASGQ